MLREAWGLTDEELEGVAALERRVVAHDGGRLKLEWNRLRSRNGEMVEDVLAHDDGQLIGFVGLYGPGPAQIEIMGMVDPDHRRRGIGGELLARALDLCADRGVGAPLLIAPRGSAGARALADRHRATLDHSEHALELATAPSPGPNDPDLILRPATVGDAGATRRILTDGFGFAPTGLVERLSEPGMRALVGERDGQTIATLRVQEGDGRADIYGFAVDAGLRGRGIGRDLLRRVCEQLRADEVRRIGLEVEVDNDRALGLYTSLGFQPVVTEDYWMIAVDGEA